MSNTYTLPAQAENVDTETQIRLRRRLAWQIALVFPLFVCLLVGFLTGPTRVAWQTASGILLLSLVLTASVTDLLWHKIPNWATYSAVLWALSINAFASLMGFPQINEVLGSIGFTESLLGATVPFLFMLVIFSLTGGGAGDVKLTAAIGAFLGLNLAIDAILFSFIFAGGFALTRAVLTKGPMAILELVWRKVGNLLFPIWILPPTAEQQAFMREPMALGPSFALGTALVVFELNAAGVVGHLGHLGQALGV